VEGFDFPVEEDEEFELFWDLEGRKRIEWE
jgi:hypothetical protein